MQLYNMDCTGRRSNQSERDPDLGEDLSRDVASDDDIRDCDSIDGDHHVIRATRLNVATLKRQHSNSNNSNNNKNRNIHSNHKNNNNNNSSSAFVGDMSFVGNANSVSLGVGSGMGVRSPDHHADLQMSHHHQFPTNHPLNALGNFMGIGGLHGIPNLQHNDVLEKLKMQVRDMKVGLMEQDYAAAAHAAAFGQNLLPTSLNPAFSMPPTSMAQFEHRAQSLSVQAGGGGGGGSGGGGGIGVNTGVANGNSQNSQHTGGNNNVGVSGASCLTNGGTGLLGGGANGSGGGGPSMGGSGGGVGGGSSGNGGFSFTSPTAPSSKDVNPASNSSTSSEASNSSQQNNAWSFEEQYKQVRQLYEINDDPKRKEFLDDLFSFMQKRGTPINRLPIMAKSVLDLYELYNLVIARGGLVDVINKKLWQEIIKGLHLPSSITSAAFTLRTQYMKYLYPYECDKKNLSTPAELQAAIDGNRREGRRSSYGQYEAMHTQMQMPQIGRPTLPGSIQQMSPLALVTHAANNQQAQAAAAAAAAHHRLMAPSFGQMPNLMTHEFEQRMMEYIKLIQVKKEQQNNAAAAAVAAAAAASGNVGGVVGADAAALARVSAAGSGNAAHIKQQQHQHSASPEPVNHEAMNALDISRVAFWQMYHNNTSPPTSINASPQGSVVGAANIGGVNAMGVPSLNEQNSEALNLSDSPPNINNIKREREREQSPEPCDRDDFHNQSPPAKRGALNFPTGFYLPPGMAAAAAAAAAANFHQQNHSNNHLPQDSDGEDGDDDADTHNTTNNSMAQDEESERPALNGHHLQQHHLHQLHHLPHNLQMPHHQHLVNNTSGNHDKSDDSAIENSPSTSAVSAGGGGVDSANDNGACGGSASGHISPVSTKKIHLSKQQNNGGASAMDCSGGGAGRAQSNSPSLGGVEDALNLLSGMQFRVARNGTNANGEQQLTVNLELNGVKYSGVLIANTANNTNSRAPSVADLQQNKCELMENNELTDATADEAKDMSAGGTSGADADIEDEDMADMASTTSTDEATPTKLNKNVGNALTAINNNGALNDSNVISDTVMSAS